MRFLSALLATAAVANAGFYGAPNLFRNTDGDCDLTVAFNQANYLAYRTTSSSASAECSCPGAYLGVYAYSGGKSGQLIVQYATQPSCDGDGVPYRVIGYSFGTNDQLTLEIDDTTSIVLDKVAVNTTFDGVWHGTTSNNHVTRGATETPWVAQLQGELFVTHLGAEAVGGSVGGLLKRNDPEAGMATVYIAGSTNDDGGDVTAYNFTDNTPGDASAGFTMVNEYTIVESGTKYTGQSALNGVWATFGDCNFLIDAQYGVYKSYFFPSPTGQDCGSSGAAYGLMDYNAAADTLDIYEGFHTETDRAHRAFNITLALDGSNFHLQATLNAGDFNRTFYKLGAARDFKIVTQEIPQVLTNEIIMEYIQQIANATGLSTSNIVPMVETSAKRVSGKVQFALMSDPSTGVSAAEAAAIIGGEVDSDSEDGSSSAAALAVGILAPVAAALLM